MTPGCEEVYLAVAFYSAFKTSHKYPAGEVPVGISSSQPGLRLRKIPYNLNLYAGYASHSAAWRRAARICSQIVPKVKSTYLKYIDTSESQPIGRVGGCGERKSGGGNQLLKGSKNPEGNKRS